MTPGMDPVVEPEGDRTDVVAVCRCTIKLHQMNGIKKLNWWLVAKFHRCQLNHCSKPRHPVFG